MKAKGTEVMKKLSEKDLQNCFQQWKIRIERCRLRGGGHFEVDNIFIMRLVEKQILTPVQLFHRLLTYLHGVSLPKRVPESVGWEGGVADISDISTDSIIEAKSLPAIYV
jgi:hypothetical protein